MAESVRQLGDYSQYRQGAARQGAARQWPAPSYTPEPQWQTPPNIKEIPGGKLRSASESQRVPLAIKAALVMAFMILLAAMITTVGMWDLSSKARYSQKAASARISALNSSGSILEAEYSKLTNPQNIQQQAAEKLGMSEDTDPEYLQAEVSR
ncbi:MAG: hypothetical protein FWF71_03680 [Actinomycetia bacterium]|nr:hypothetical protein [Actinomycetes bacterium]